MRAFHTPEVDASSGAIVLLNRAWQASAISRASRSGVRAALTPAAQVTRNPPSSAASAILMLSVFLQPELVGKDIPYGIDIMDLIAAVVIRIAVSLRGQLPQDVDGRLFLKLP